MGTYIPLIANTLTSSKAPKIIQVNNNSPSEVLVFEASSNQDFKLNHDSLTGLFCCYFKLKLQAYQFLNQKKKKRSGRAMTENWNLVSRQLKKLFK